MTNLTAKERTWTVCWNTNAKRKNSFCWQLKHYCKQIMLNYSGLHLNERGTTCLVSNLCSSLAEWRYLNSVDTTFTNTNDLENPQINITKNLEPVSSMISANRPLVNIFSHLVNIGIFKRWFAHQSHDQTPYFQKS